MIANASGRTPVVVITGFLGSGKTTLVNHLLAGARFGRVAALVNDFGAMPRSSPRSPTRSCS